MGKCDGCGVACLKYLLILFNVVVFAAGIALVAISAWVLIDSSSFQNLVNTEGMSSLFTAIWLIFGIGIALFLLGLMGCYGSTKESRIMLALYFFLIFVIFVVEIVAAILAFVFYPEVRDVAMKTTANYGRQLDADIFANETLQRQELIEDVIKYWDVIQDKISCCGYTSKDDWHNTYFYNKTEQSYPPSCCGYNFEDDLKPEIASGIFNHTCSAAEVKKFTNDLACEAIAKNNVMVVGGVALGILFIEFLAMMASCCLYRSLDDTY